MISKIAALVGGDRNAPRSAFGVRRFPFRQSRRSRRFLESEKAILPNKTRFRRTAVHRPQQGAKAAKNAVGGKGEVIKGIIR